MSAYTREDVHATHQCIVSDGLVNAMPNMQKTLLQSVLILYGAPVMSLT